MYKNISYLFYTLIGISTTLITDGKISLNTFIQESDLVIDVTPLNLDSKRLDAYNTTSTSSTLYKLKSELKNHQTPSLFFKNLNYPYSTDKILFQDNPDSSFCMLRLCKINKVIWKRENVHINYVDKDNNLILLKTFLPYSTNIEQINEQSIKFSSDTYLSDLYKIHPEWNMAYPPHVYYTGLNTHPLIIRKYNTWNDQPISFIVTCKVDTKSNHINKLGHTYAKVPHQFILKPNNKETKYMKANWADIMDVHNISTKFLSSFGVDLYNTITPTTITKAENISQLEYDILTNGSHTPRDLYEFVPKITLSKKLSYVGIFPSQTNFNLEQLKLLAGNLTQPPTYNTKAYSDSAKYRFIWDINNMNNTDQISKFNISAKINSLTPIHQH